MAYLLKLLLRFINYIEIKLNKAFLNSLEKSSKDLLILDPRFIWLLLYPGQLLHVIENEQRHLSGQIYLDNFLFLILVTEVAILLKLVYCFV